MSRIGHCTHAHGMLVEVVLDVLNRLSLLADPAISWVVSKITAFNFLRNLSLFQGSVVIRADSPFRALRPVRAQPRFVVEGVVLKLFPSMALRTVHVELTL